LEVANLPLQDGDGRCDLTNRVNACQMHDRVNQRNEKMTRRARIEIGTPVPHNGHMLLGDPWQLRITRRAQVL